MFLVANWQHKENTYRTGGIFPDREAANAACIGTCDCWLRLEVGKAYTAKELKNVRVSYPANDYYILKKEVLGMPPHGKAKRGPKKATQPGKS